VLKEQYKKTMKVYKESIEEGAKPASAKKAKTSTSKSVTKKQDKDKLTPSKRA